MKTVKSMKKKSVKTMLLCVAFALFVSGCGIQGGETDPAGKDTQAGVETPKKPSALPEKFRLEDAKEGEGKEEGGSDANPYYVREYADYEPGDLSGKTSHISIYRLHPKGQFILKIIYSQISEEEDIWKSEGYLEHYPDNQFSPEVRKICFEQEEIKDGDVESFDVLEEGYVFAVICRNPDQDGPKVRHYAVCTDWEGAPVKVLETTPEIDGLPVSYQLYADGKGYLCEVYTQQIFVMNEEGQQIGSLDLSEGRRNAVSQVLRDDGGSLLFVVSLGLDQYRFLSLNEKGGWQERGVLDFQRTVEFVGISGGEIYFCDSSDLVAWDTESGSQRKVISLARLGYSFGDELLLLGNPEGDFRVRCVRSQEDYGMLLSRERDFETDTINLLGLNNSDSWKNVVRGCGDFNRKTPDLSVAVEEFLEQDMDRSRFLMDLVLGEEVDYDILFVSGEDMKMLAEAGAIADLRTILFEETLQAFYPAVLELGTHEGMLAGLTQQITVRTLVTRRSLWDGDTWTVQDIQKILEEHPQIREILAGDGKSFQYGASELLLYFYGYDLENSGLYDRETGESYFEKNGFASALEMAKKHVANPEEKFGYEKLKDEECLVVLADFDSFFSFSGAMSQHWDKDSDHNVVVGFPVAGNGAKYYVYATGYFVVNKKSQKQESIRRFLEYMMGADNLARIEYGMGNVRRDMIDRCVKCQTEKSYSWDAGTYFWNVEGSATRYRLELKKDGTPYTKEWEAILEECRPARRSEEIWEIVEEESSQFFEGTLDAQTAVKRIDSRVTLYLKEQK